MTFSPVRSMIFFMIGLPIGFILSALIFVSLGRPIEAAALAPFALAVAVVIGTVAGFRRAAP